MSTPRVCKTTLSLALLLLTTNLAWSASFDCTKAVTISEKMICANKELSISDEKMAQIYNKALGVSPDPQNLKKQQKSWIKLIRDVCLDISCMLKAYEKRMSELDSYIAAHQPPKSLVRLFFAELCSEGCSEEEKSDWRENFRWELHDLNKDSVPEYFLYIDDQAWCGAVGNCTYWIYQRTSGGYRLLVGAFPKNEFDDLPSTRLYPLGTYTKGYCDLASDHRIGPDERIRTVYKYDGHKYKAVSQKTIQVY